MEIPPGHANEKKRIEMFESRAKGNIHQFETRRGGGLED